jgi:hypothetical protein
MRVQQLIAKGPDLYGMFDALSMVVEAHRFMQKVL